MAISTGVAIANLAKASVIGGISASASLMNMNEAAQMQTRVPANVNETRVLFVAVCLPVLYVRFATLRWMVPCKCDYMLLLWRKRILAMCVGIQIRSENFRLSRSLRIDFYLPVPGRAG